MKMKAYLFGEYDDTFSLSEESVTSIIEQSREASVQLHTVPLSKRISILSAVGKLWAKGSDVYTNALEKMKDILPFSDEVTEYSLCLIESLLSKEELTKRVLGEFSVSDVDHVSTFVDSDSYTGTYSYLPLGSVLNVAAGNIFLGALDSLISAILTGNSLIIKLSSEDPFFLFLFAKTVELVDTDSLVKNSFALIPFKSGNIQVESAFKNMADAIIVWGGKAAIEAYRTNLSPACKLIEHGPKLSLSLFLKETIDSEKRVKAAAAALATDVALWDQSACSSPQCVFVEGDLEKAKTVAAAIAAELDSIHHKWPSGDLSFDEKVELTKMREQAAYAEANDEGALFMPFDRSPAYTVVATDDGALETSPLNRSLYVKPLVSVEQLCTELRPRSGYLQAASIAGDSVRIDEVGKLLLQAGVQRISAVGDMLFEKAGAPHDGRFNLVELMRAVNIEQPVPPFVRVSDLFADISAKSDFWKERLKGFNPTSRDSLGLVPFTTSRELVENVPPLGKKLLTGDVRNAMVFASGGSTGKPKYIFYGNEEFADVSRALARCMAAAGLKRSDIAANGFVAGSLWTSFLAVHNALKSIGCFNLPIGGTSSVMQTVHYIVDFKATVVLGIPSYLTELARAISHEGLKDKLNVRLLLYAGERVTDSTAEYLCNAFGCTLIRSAGYASVDAGTIGYQCSHCEGSHHHLLTDYQYVEFVSPETGKPVPVGESGEIVATNLNRRLMPVVRMKTGDLGSMTSISCPCGSPDPVFHLLGRADDRVFAGGARFMAGDFARLAGTFHCLSSRVQIELTNINGLDHVHFYIESQEPLSAEKSETLAEEVIDAFITAEEDFRFAYENDWIGRPQCTIVETGTIPRVERTGKIRLLSDKRHSDS